MKTNFWSNLDQARKGAGKERKAVIEECDLSNNAFTQGIRRKSDPSVSTAYRCAKSVYKTVEELIDGEAGEQYLREYIRNKGWGFSPPERIADIVEATDGLSDEQLDYVMGLIKAMLDKKGESGVTPR
jgi:transcriptional regulator with XRE-family HTH domain